MFSSKQNIVLIAVFPFLLLFDNAISQEWIHGGPCGADVTVIEPDPSDSNFIYLGTKKHGIFISDDCGNTWRKANDGISLYQPYNPDFYHWQQGEYDQVFFVEAHPLIDGSVWASLPPYGIYHSDNYGEEWYSSDQGLPEMYHPYTLSFNPFDSNTIILGGYPGLFISNDCGITWNECEVLPNDDPYRVESSIFSPEIEDYIIIGIFYLNSPVIGINHCLMHSYDAGVTWDTLRPMIGAWDIAIKSSCCDSIITRSVYNTMDFSVIRLDLSSDGGSTWDIIDLFDPGWPGCWDIHYAGNSRLYAEHNSSIYTSNDFGITWNQVVSDLPLEDYEGYSIPLYISSNPIRSELFYYGYTHGIYCYDVANNVELSYNNAGLDNTFIETIAVHPTDNSICYAGSECGLWKTTDGGENWHKISNENVKYIAIDPLYPDTVYWGGENLRRSFDGGDTWLDLNIGLWEEVKGIAIHPIETNILYYVTAEYYFINQYFYMSENRGESRVRVDLTHGMTTNIETISSSPDYVYRGSYSGISYTDDSGLTWHNLFETGSFKHLEIDDSGQKICGYWEEYCAQNIIVSNDGGNTFESFALPDSITFHLGLAINPANINQILLATEIGVISYEEENDSWIHIEGPYGKPSTNIEFTPDGTSFYIGSYGHGIWQAVDIVEVEENDHHIDSINSQSYDILEIYPNPFNSSARIRIKIAQTKDHSLRIYNIKGQLIRTFTGLSSQPGIMDVYWDGTDKQGTTVSSGIYFAALETPENTVIKKIVFAK